MKMRTQILIALLGLLLLPAAVVAQTNSPLEQLRVSYIYSAVMGTGSYKIDNRRISMLRIPFAYTQHELTEEQNGLKWHAPVVVGYDALNYPDWLSRIVDDELATLSIMPGIEILYRAGDIWVLKPFANLGVAYDFVREETIPMGVVGLRALGTWVYTDRSEFRVGTSARYAAEYQIKSSTHSTFTMFEAGVDYRRDIHLKVFAHDTNVGLYYRAQLFLPEWDLIKEAANLESSIGLIHEVGASIGLQKPRKILGIPISRVRVGFKFGDAVRGWTIGTDFPF
jgi:hypothetical protein